MEKLAAEPAAGEEHKLRTPRLPMSSFTCDLMSSAQCRGQGGRERAGKSQGSHLMSPVLLLKVMSTNLGNLSTNVGNLGNLSTNLGNLEIWEIWKIWEIWICVIPGVRSKDGTRPFEWQGPDQTF